MTAYGVRAWFRDLSYAPSAQAKKSKQFTASWADILGHWSHIELDLHDQGIDVESGVLEQRTWRWLQLRILGLLSTPSSRLHRALKPAKQEVPHGVQGSA